MLKEELKKLIVHAAQTKDWAYVRAWFTYWDSEEELAEKVILWGRFFMSSYFKQQSPPFHLELIRKNFSKQNEYSAAPRGFGKTTINQLCMMYSVVNKMDEFIVIVEKTFGEASEILRSIRDEFATNERVLLVYGDMIGKDDTGTFNEKAKDAEGDMLINGVRLRAKGFNQPIRGLKSKEWRPTTIYCDDIEEDAHINSIDQRDKYKANFTQGIIPAVDIDGNIKMVGTILHHDSLLTNQVNMHNGTIWRAFDVKDPENTLLWPERWTYERLMEKKHQMTVDGFGSSKFSQEYLNEPIDDTKRPFKWEWLQKTYKDLPEFLEIYAAIDVADSAHENSDYTGVVVVAIDNTHKWHILYAKRYNVTVTGLIDVVFDIWQKFKPNRIGVEKKAFEDQVQPLLKVRSEQTGIYPSVVELKHGGKRKEDRIMGALQGRFENDAILFTKGFPEDQKILQGELYDFPRGKNDDLADALAYISDFAYRSYKKEEKKDTRPAHQRDDVIQKILDDAGKPSSWLDY